MKTFLIAYKSGHYKKLEGKWDGDGIWGHFTKSNGNKLHVNKAEVEYIETWESGPSDKEVIEKLKQEIEEERMHSVARAADRMRNENTQQCMQGSPVNRPLGK